MSKMNVLKLYLKGFLMGLCDLIPGISGGTIAFITGIYDKLIGEVNNFFHFRKFDWKFLLVLGIGIVSAILALSHLISYLLKYYMAFTMSFFFGLILASSKFIFSDIPIKKKNYWFGIFGFSVGLLFLLLSPTIVFKPSILYVILGGFLAISAMFLPGISGSFILLILGLYEYIITAVKTFDYVSLSYFGVGVLIGAVVISRIIHFFLSRFKSQTLYFLFGLVIGSSLILVNKIAEVNNNYLDILSFSVFFLMGLIFSYSIGKLRKKSD